MGGSTNNAVALRSKRKSSKPLLKRLKQHLNKKKTRSSELSLSLDKFDKKLIERSMRRKKSLTTHAKITNAPWTQCRHHWKPNPVQRQKLFEDETRQKLEITEKAGLAERKANALQGEVEEARALLDSADRSKKQTDMELGEARAAVNDMTTINSKAGADKRRLEGAVHTMHAEIDDMLSQAKHSEEKAKKAMADAARLADELRAEQDHAGSQEKAKRALETQILELEQRLAEANEMASKGGRNAMAKLESRIRELEIELGSVQCKTSETYKSFQKAEH